MVRRILNAYDNFNHFYLVAAIVMADADMSLALPAVFFGAVGTAGQRCTSTRRLYLQRSIASAFIERLQSAYRSVRPGDPLVDGTLLGPVHTKQAMGLHLKTIQNLKISGAEILAGGNSFETSEVPKELSQGYYVRPTLALPKSEDPCQEIWSKETFAPILNVAIFDELEEAIEYNNAVPQGLSSTLWTRDVRNIGKWLGPGGSDCGIVNVCVWYGDVMCFSVVNLEVSRSTSEQVGLKLGQRLVGIRCDFGQTQ